MSIRQGSSPLWSSHFSAFMWVEENGPSTPTPYATHPDTTRQAVGEARAHRQYRPISSLFCVCSPKNRIIRYGSIVSLKMCQCSMRLPWTEAEFRGRRNIHGDNDRERKPEFPGGTFVNRMSRVGLVSLGRPSVSSRVCDCFLLQTERKRCCRPTESSTTTKGCTDLAHWPAFLPLESVGTMLVCLPSKAFPWQRRMEFSWDWLSLGITNSSWQMLIPRRLKHTTVKTLRAK